MSIADAVSTTTGSNGKPVPATNKWFDPVQANAWLDALEFGETGCAEIRILDANLDPRTGFIGPHDQWKAIYGGYFVDRSKLLAAVAKVSLNPLDRNLLARANNRLKKLKTGSSTANKNAICRRWLYLDFDPDRLPDISSTDEELADAVARRDQFLAENPDFAASSHYGRSGNGALVVTRLDDLPNDDAHNEMVVRVTAILSERYTDAKVKLDTQTTNIARIGPMIGCVKCKGDPIPKRPWRMSILESRPGKREPFDLVAWERRNARPDPAPAVPAPRAATGAACATSGGTATDRATLVRRATAYLATKPGAVAGDGGHDATFDAACILVKGFDLTLDEARPLLTAYSARCDPPWSDREIEHKLSSADTKADSEPRGYLARAERNGHANGYVAISVDAFGPAGYATTAGNGDGHPAEPAADEARKAQDVPGEEESCSPGMEANPHRLARLFRDRRFSHPDRHKITYWQGQFHGWRRGAYGAIPAQEMRAELAKFIEEEFTRLHGIACMKFKMSQGGGKSDGSGDKSKPPQMRPVTTTLVADVLQALSGDVLMKLDDYPEMPAWLHDAPPWPAEEVLPAANALVHLPSLVKDEDAIRPPTPGFFSSYALDYEFDADAPAAVNWLTFLGKLPVTGDSKVNLQLWPRDPDSIDFLQEWFGYHLGRGADQQKALAMIGPKRSGKGTIAFMLAAMIGTENVAGPTLSELSTQFGLQSLIGKPCAIIDDARLSGKTDVAVLVERLLSITGQGKMNVPRKNQLDWVGTLTSKFTIITNETPRLPDSSEAIASRLMFLHLNESFYGREDHALKAKLLPELPGILLWAIEGWRRLRDRGHFKQPESGKELAREMAELGSPIWAFVRERCVIEPGRKIMVGELYHEWKMWCLEKGRDHPGDEPGFGRNLRSVMPNLKTTNNHVEVDGTKKKKRHFEGIDLRPPGSWGEERCPLGTRWNAIRSNSALGPEEIEGEDVMSPATANNTDATRTQVRTDRVPTRSTWPPAWLQNPTQPHVGVEVSSSVDWPAAWADDFKRMAAENRELGHPPGEAARLAYEALKARASGGLA